MIACGRSVKPWTESIEKGRFTAQSEETPPENITEAIHFDLRSDTESVRSGGPQDAMDSTALRKKWPTAEVEVGVPRHWSLHCSRPFECGGHIQTTGMCNEGCSEVRFALEEVTVDNPARS